MLFVIQFEDVYETDPGRLPEREKHMAAHLAYLAEHQDMVVASGALRATPDGPPVGGIWIVVAPALQAAEALYKADPFYKAGLRRSVRVHHWAKAYWSPEFAACMRPFGLG
jgi:hypothetical protein